MSRPKLLVVLGAGSSVGVGMPSVSDLDELMLGWAKAWEQAGGLDYYTPIAKAAQAHAASGSGRPRPVVTFETILGDLLALAHWLTPAPFGPSLRHLIGDIDLPRNLVFPEKGYGPGQRLREQLGHLLGKLASELRQRSRALNPAKPASIDYRTLITALLDRFDVGIFNLNYDAAALAAWPEADTGFRDGKFSPLSVHERVDWGFVYHLHGSVHHTLADCFSDTIHWRSDLGETFIDGHQGNLGREASGGLVLPKSILLAGGAKLDQLLAEPFHSFHAALVRAAHAADAVLIGGYGFADVHVNWALRNRFDGLARPDRPPVAVLGWAEPDTEPMAYRLDAWSTNLERILSAPASFFREPGQTNCARPKDLARRNAFEVSAEHRTAIWYGGFHQAAARVSALTEWLAGGDDAFLGAIPAQGSGSS